MTLRQLTVFVENKQGALVKITDLLAANGIDMRALSLADTKEFGILRLIVDDTEKALDVLKNAGVLANITPVIGVKISDEPGKLSAALAALDKAGVNVEYLYAFLSRTPRHAYVVLRVSDNDAAGAALAAADFHTVCEKDFLKL